MRIPPRLTRLLLTLETQSNGLCTPLVCCCFLLNTLIFLSCLISGIGSPGPAPLTRILLADPRILEGQVWRALSAAFTHQEVLHWFFNMFGLVIFGGKVERYLGAGRFILLLLAAALLGNLFHVGVMGGAVLGFSGVVFALILAFAAIDPHARFLLMLIVPAPAWLVASIAVGLSFLSLLQYDPSSLVAHDVHLVGAAIGLIAILGPRHCWGPWLRARRQQGLLKQHLRLEQDHKELDRLLEKVSQEGLPALSKAERAFLQRFSAQQRANHEQ